MKKKIIFLIIAIFLITGSILSLIFIPKFIANAETNNNQDIITEETQQPTVIPETPKEYVKIDFYGQGEEEMIFYGVRFVEKGSYLEDTPYFKTPLRTEPFKPEIGDHLVLGADYSGGYYEFLGWAVNGQSIGSLSNYKFDIDSKVEQEWAYHIGLEGGGSIVC